MPFVEAGERGGGGAAIRRQAGAGCGSEVSCSQCNRCGAGEKVHRRTTFARTVLSQFVALGQSRQRFRSPCRSGTGRAKAGRSTPRFSHCKRAVTYWGSVRRGEGGVKHGACLNAWSGHEC